MAEPTDGGKNRRGGCKPRQLASLESRIGSGAPMCRRHKHNVSVSNQVLQQTGHASSGLSCFNVSPA
jgi:hypothetical protein